MGLRGANLPPGRPELGDDGVEVGLADRPRGCNPVISVDHVVLTLQEIEVHGRKAAAVTHDLAHAPIPKIRIPLVK